MRCRTEKAQMLKVSRLDTAQADTYTLLFALGRARNAPVKSIANQSSKNRLVRTGKMPNHKSAEKRVRQNEKRREINRDNRGRLRTSIKKLRTALTTGDNKTVQELLPATISTIDKAVQKGVLHRNAAARYKSRLTTHVNQTGAK
jgi:small subunit ribosomal protein S20